MFLRSTRRKKNGKTHTYWNIVENKRLDDGRVVQRQVLYLGEINSSQLDAWRHAIDVIDETTGQARTLALFPEDRNVVSTDSQTVQVRLSKMRLCRPRQWGACWLAGQLWRELQLDGFSGRASAAQPQGHPVGSRAAGAGVLSADCAGKRMEAAPGLVWQERHGRSAGSGFRAGRSAQALCLSRSSAGI